MGYIEQGYVQSGYFEGDNLIALSPGSTVKLKFFISDGKDIDNEIVQMQDGLADNEVGLLYMPSLKKMMMASKTSFVEFITAQSGNVNVDEVANSVKDKLLGDSGFIDAVKSDVVNSLEMYVSFVDKNGATLATPVVTRDGTKFTFDVPPELAGIEYGVVVEVN